MRWYHPLLALFWVISGPYLYASCDDDDDFYDKCTILSGHSVSGAYDQRGRIDGINVDGFVRGQPKELVVEGILAFNSARVQLTLSQDEWETTFIGTLSLTLSDELLMMNECSGTITFKVGKSDSVEVLEQKLIQMLGIESAQTVTFYPASEENSFVHKILCDKDWNKYYDGYRTFQLMYQPAFKMFSFLGMEEDYTNTSEQIAIDLYKKTHKATITTSAFKVILNPNFVNLFNSTSSTFKAFFQPVLFKVPFPKSDRSFPQLGQRLRDDDSDMVNDDSDEYLFSDD